MEITESEYNELKRKAEKLDHLEMEGVRSWKFYQIAMGPIRRDDWEKVLCVSADAIDELFGESDISEPAGVGCGYSASFDDDVLEECVKKIVRKVREYEKEHGIEI